MDYADPMKDIHLRLPDDLHATLVAASADDERSLNGEILWLLKQTLEAR